MPIGGNGGSRPFNGGTITAPETIDVGSLATAGGLTITGTSGANVNRLVVDFLHTLLALTGDGVLTISSDDTMGVTVSGQANSGASFTLSNTPTTTSVVMSADTNGGQVEVSDASNNTLAGMSYAFGLLTKLNTAPADAVISIGSCALWFDKTNGAAKLMLKGRTANSTLVTGSVALT